MQHIVRIVYLRIYICLNFQRALRSRRFADEEEVKKAVHDWLPTLSKESPDDSRKLVDSWTKSPRSRGGEYQD
jgi:hypothetical protein